jgi:recombination protein RecA
MKITNRQNAIIIGTLIGDGCLERNGKYARLRIDHSINQKEYLWWKYNELKTLVPSKPVIISSYHKKEQKEYKRLHFATYSLDLFECYWKALYTNNRKTISNFIYAWLKDPLSLAVWYMDDGCKRNDCNALRISADAFSLSEQKVLQDMLRKNFNIMATLHRKGKWWNLYIPKKEASKFVELVFPYIIPSLKYKIALTP